MFKRIIVLTIVCFFSFSEISAQTNGEFEIARASYRGGGDWYNDPSALTNLIRFAKSEFPLPIANSYKDVSLGSAELFNYPFVFLTGHGNITLNSSEIRNVRTYLDNGGFLYIDDDYGLDEFIRPIISELFPDEELIELPFSHPIYHQAYSFENGIPKIHEHDGKPSQGFGIFRNGKLVLFYTYESNLGDGWADPEIHNTPENLRRQALQMGTNILIYALTNER